MKCFQNLKATIHFVHNSLSQGSGMGSAVRFISGSHGFRGGVWAGGVHFRVMFSLTDLAPGGPLASLSCGWQLILRALPSLFDPLEWGLSVIALLTWGLASRSECPRRWAGEWSVCRSGPECRHSITFSTLLLKEVVWPAQILVERTETPTLNGRSVRESRLSLIQHRHLTKVSLNLQ